MTRSQKKSSLRGAQRRGNPEKIHGSPRELTLARDDEAGSDARAIALSRDDDLCYATTKLATLYTKQAICATQINRQLKTFNQ